MTEPVHSMTEGTGMSNPMKKKYGRLMAVGLATLGSLGFYMNVIDSSAAHPAEGVASSSTTPTFLYAIFSTKQDKERRDMIRKTILTSLPEEELCPLHEYMRAMDEGKYPSTCRILYTFVVGNIEGKEGPGEHMPDNETPVAIDASLIPNGEPDIVYLNIRENMNEGKSPTWFKYASELVDKYDIDFVSKADSDTFMSMSSLLKFIDRDLPPRPADPNTEDHRRIFGGAIVDQGVCGGETFDHCKNLVGKVYMEGQFYFISSDLPKFLNSPAIDRSMPVPHEDYDFGIRVLSNPLPINLLILSGQRFWLHGGDLKTEEGWMSQWEETASKGETPILFVPPWWPRIAEK